MVLATWAASFGINEAGEPDANSELLSLRSKKDRVNMMVQELLQLIDVHGLLRKPTCRISRSYPGICRSMLTFIILFRGRCSCLTTHFAINRGLVGSGTAVSTSLSPFPNSDIQLSMERLAMYEVAINQVYTLCSQAAVTTVNSGRGQYVDAAVRARIFWYAHVHEGITTGLRGGRLLLYVLEILLPNSYSCWLEDRMMTSMHSKRRSHPLDQTYHKQPWDILLHTDTQKFRFAFQRFAVRCTSA